MENLVREALIYYNFKNPQLTFIRHNENITYKIDDDGRRYVIRIRKPKEGFTDSIFGIEYTPCELMENEMKMLEYVRQHSGLLLQKPVRCMNGELTSCLSDGSPVCVLEWIEGSILNENTVTEEQAYMLGVMAAKLHKGFDRMPFQVKRLSYSTSIINPMKDQLSQAVCKEQLTKETAGWMKEALNVIGERMEELSMIPEMAGIIHADLGLSNVILSDTGLIPIDFSLSGYGYYPMEIAMMMSQFKDKRLRKLIRQGYEIEREWIIPVRYIDAFYALSVLLFICCQHDKASREEWFPNAVERWRNTIFQPLVKGIEYVL